MSEPIFVKNLKGLERLIALKCDKDGNGILEKTDSFDEISLFNTMKNDYKKEGTGSSIFNDKYIAKRDATYVAPKFMPKPVRVKELINKAKENKTDEKKTEEMNKNISSIIEKEIKKRGGNVSQIDLPYWSKRIDRVSKKYNFPPELLTAIIAKESCFEKNINSSNGKGPMGVTGIACRAFFPGARGNWNGIYKQMNETLLNDILYKKDNNGNFVKDAKGDYILKYNTAEELRDACAADDELGIQVGLLSFEMHYVCAFAEKYYSGPAWKTAHKAIDAIKNDSIKMNAIESQNLVETALKNYNSVFSSYASSVIDSLKSQGIKFEELDIIK